MGRDSAAWASPSFSDDPQAWRHHEDQRARHQTEYTER